MAKNSFVAEITFKQLWDIECMQFYNGSKSFKQRWSENSVEVRDRDAGVCKAVVAAGMLIWTDIDCFPHQSFP